MWSCGGEPWLGKTQQDDVLECLPAIVNHCTDQQQATCTLIEISSRVHAEIQEMRDALRQMETRMNTRLDGALGGVASAALRPRAAGDPANNETDGNVVPRQHSGALRPCAGDDLASSENVGMALPQVDLPPIGRDQVNMVTVETDPLIAEPQRQEPEVPQAISHCCFEYMLGHLGTLPEIQEAELRAAKSYLAKRAPQENSKATLAQGVKFPLYRDKDDTPRFLKHFDTVALAFIACNALFVCLAENDEMKVEYSGGERANWFETVDTCFTICFTIEICVRMYMWGFKGFFWKGVDRAWNIMDCVFVGSSIVELMFSVFDLSVFRIVRAARVLRVFRAVRGMRFIRQLRFMLASIAASLSSFMWGGVLFCFVLHIMALALMQSLIILSSSNDVVISPEVYDLYGSVEDAMISLFMAVSGGRDWADLLSPLQKISNVYLYAFSLYVAIVVFGVMNVLTAVFCENASHIVGIDTGLVVEDEVMRAQADHSQIKRCFMKADGDHNGRLSLPELLGFLQNPDRRALLSLFSVDVAEARGLFDLMATDADGAVDINDFVDAIMRLKGPAKGCDTAMLMFESKRMMIRIACLMCYASDNFTSLFNELRTERSPIPLEQYLTYDVLQEKEAEARKMVQHGLSAQLVAHSSDLPSVRRPKRADVARDDSSWQIHRMAERSATTASSSASSAGNGVDPNRREGG